jgi:hypothetical protein
VIVVCPLRSIVLRKPAPVATPLEWVLPLIVAVPSARRLAKFPELVDLQEGRLGYRAVVEDPLLCGEDRPRQAGRTRRSWQRMWSLRVAFGDILAVDLWRVL